MSTITPITQTPTFAPNFLQKTYTSLVNVISLIARAILAIPRAICRGLKYMAQRIVMHFVYPAQSWLGKRSLNEIEWIARLNDYVIESGMYDYPTIESISLDHNGKKLEGWILHHPNQRKCENWILQSVGNCAAAQDYIPIIGDQYMKAGFNTLLVNNPGVAGSEGTSTPKTMGEAQSIGITHLETKEGAKNVAVAGHSMGGAANGQAVLQHNFKQGSVNYLFVPQMTFGRLSHIAQKIVPQCFKWAVPSIIIGLDLEMDNVAASQRLAELNIPEYVINTREAPSETNRSGYLHDGVIPPKGTLGHRLYKANITHLKTTDYEIPDGHQPLKCFAHNAEHAIELTARVIREWRESLSQPSASYTPSFAERFFKIA